MEAGHHPRQHIHCEGDPRPPHRLAALFIDHNEIHLGVVDLHDLQGAGRGVFPGDSIQGTDSLGVPLRAARTR